MQNLKYRWSSLELNKQNVKIEPIQNGGIDSIKEKKHLFRKSINQIENTTAAERLKIDKRNRKRTENIIQTIKDLIYLFFLFFR